MQRQNKRYQKNKKVRSRKFLYILLAAIVVALLAGFGVWRFVAHKDNNDSKMKNTSASKSGSGDNEPTVNYDPPTPQDKTENDQHKDELVQQQQQTPPPSSNVTPIITSYGQYNGNIEVSSIVPSIIEDGGTCTLTATMGSNKVTKQTTAIRNAQDTTCPTFTIPRSEFAAPGNWTINVKYSSAKYSGTSEAKTIKVE